MNVDISSWDLRNVSALPSGELCVRESFVTSSNDSNTGTAVAGWTVKCQTTDVVWHYIIRRTTADGVLLFILDEDFNTIQKYTYNIFIQPKDVSLSVIEDQIMICSPDLPPLWGIVGSGVVVATTVTSVNPATTALENIPMGISVAWAGRNVIATRETMFFSDALYPRTYVGQNAIDPPGGSIYGLHVNAGGALIVCTTTGVYALPEDAATSGQLVLGVFSKLTDYECIGYRTTASCKGRVYGLTRKGFCLVDAQGAEETPLDEQVNSIAGGTGRIHFNDYKQGKIFGATDGLYVYMGTTAMLYADVTLGFKSWWTSSSISSLSGIGFENDGTEVLFMAGPWVKRGNSPNNEGDAITALVSGRIKVGPELSPVVRYVTFASDTHSDFTCFIRDTTKTQTPNRFAPVIGTDTWTGGTKYTEPRMQSRQFDFALRGEDLVFSLGITSHPGKIPNIIDVVFKGPGRRRRSN